MVISKIKKQSFVIMLRPAPKYGEPETEKIVSEHFSHLQKLLADGILVVAGRFSEVLIGLVIINVNNHEDALEIMNKDPAVIAGIFHAELYPWSIALQTE
ncbi:MAG: YciI family protein [Candidatus Thorarchaeota archaeon]